MRDLRRNTLIIHYSLYVNDGSRTDRNGNPVGYYTKPEKMRISLSANKGEASAQTFGTELSYDREMVTSDKDCPIDEYSRIWIDKDVDGSYNYRVKAVAKSLNASRYAIEKVNVNEHKDVT